MQSLFYQNYYLLAVVTVQYFYVYGVSKISQQKTYYYNSKIEPKNSHGYYYYYYTTMATITM